MEQGINVPSNQYKLTAKIKEDMERNIKTFMQGVLTTMIL